MVFIYEGKKTLERREVFECLYEQSQRSERYDLQLHKYKTLNSLSQALEELLCKNFIPIMLPFLSSPET